MTECSLFSTQVSFNTLSNSQTMNTIILRLSSLCKFSLLCNLLGKIFKQQNDKSNNNNNKINHFEAYTLYHSFPSMQIKWYSVAGKDSVSFFFVYLFTVHFSWLILYTCCCCFF